MMFVGFILFLVPTLLNAERPDLSSTPTQRFDGWYNNPMNPDWGAVGRVLERNITPHYEDETCSPSGWNRPNARRISNELFGSLFAGVSGEANSRNLTALFGFFGQLVKREILHTDDTTCPMEILNTRVPAGDPDFDPGATGEKSMPYERLAYDKRTGQSPNNPRRQINKASSYIDASFLYGTSTVRAELLRDKATGKLACGDKWGKFPRLNDVRLPYHTLAVKHNTLEKLWRLGDEQVFESPPMLALSVLFYRYHNFVALDVMRKYGQLPSDQVFELTRRRVIGTLQKLVMYDWLPKLIGKDLPPYTGYKSWVKSDVTDIFDAGAINYIMTLIPPAIYQVDMNCNARMHGTYKAKRLCNSYWKAMDMVYAHEEGTVEILRGLAVQMAEKDDTYVVEDLRSKFYGPLYHSNHDLVLLTIMKGRDYGLPDYNTIRDAMGLQRKESFEDVNPELNRTNPALMQRFREVHGNNLSHVDMFVGGMMETTSKGPGELFTHILYDQFIRLRDGDRFWFENEKTGVYSKEEIRHIKSLTLADIMVNVTEITQQQIQRDVFTAAENPPCGMRVQFTESELETCPKYKGYDFFEGSEIPYIIIWACLGLLPLLCILVAYILAKFKKMEASKTA